MKKFLLFILISGGILFFVFWQNTKTEVIEINLPAVQNYQDFKETTTSDPTNYPEMPVVAESKTTSSSSEPAQVAGLKIKQEVNLNIPFTSQAPTANWGEPWQNACEEASLLMVDYYYQNKKLSNPQEVENLLKEMVGWQEENWGSHFNLTIEQVATLAQALFNYRTEVVDDLDADKVRQYLSQGFPVIVPADGHKLANPYFKGDGPDYHMLVIKGYVDDKFITNDPGTRRGADFIYTEDNLFYSIAEWDKTKSQAIGPKKGLILYRD